MDYMSVVGQSIIRGLKQAIAWVKSENRTDIQGHAKTDDELEKLTQRAKEDNRHPETDWGKPEGKEIW